MPRPREFDGVTARQTNLLLPVSGKKNEAAPPATVTAVPRRRRKA